MPGLHHVEVWIADVSTDLAQGGWLLARLGFVRESSWSEGESWAAGGTYLSLTTSPNLSAGGHDRRRPGVNHLAFKAGERETVDAIMAEAPLHGWTPLYQDPTRTQEASSTTPAGSRTPPASRPRWSQTSRAPRPAEVRDSQARQGKMVGLVRAIQCPIGGLGAGRARTCGERWQRQYWQQPRSW